MIRKGIPFLFGLKFTNRISTIFSSILHQLSFRFSSVYFCIISFFSIRVRRIHWDNYFELDFLSTIIYTSRLDPLSTTAVSSSWIGGNYKWNSRIIYYEFSDNINVLFNAFSVIFGFFCPFFLQYFGTQEFLQILF